MIGVQLWNLVCNFDNTIFYFTKKDVNLVINSVKEVHLIQIQLKIFMILCYPCISITAINEFLQRLQMLPCKNYYKSFDCKISETYLSIFNIKNIICICKLKKIVFAYWKPLHLKWNIKNDILTGNSLSFASLGLPKDGASVCILVNCWTGVFYTRTNNPALTSLSPSWPGPGVRSSTSKKTKSCFHNRPCNFLRSRGH